MAVVDSEFELEHIVPSPSLRCLLPNDSEEFKRLV